MTAPQASALLNQPPGKLSRFSNRPVATRADGRPCWETRKEDDDGKPKDI